MGILTKTSFKLNTKTVIYICDLCGSELEYEIEGVDTIFNKSRLKLPRYDEYEQNRQEAKRWAVYCEPRNSFVICPKCLKLEERES